MSEQASAAPAASESISAREAAGLISAPEEKKPVSEAEAPSPAAEPEHESADEADAAPPEEESSGETEERADPEDTPSIDPPRSWSKEDKAVFAALPRETQERLVEIDRTRELEVRRGQNETAEQRRAIDAELRAAEQSRRQYEEAVTGYAQAIEQAHLGEFSDIKTQDDLVKMQETDPLRFQRWQLSAMRSAQAKDEAERAQAQQRSEYSNQLRNYQKDQLAIFQARAPEFFDPKTASAKQTEARTYLNDVGFTQEQLAAHWDGFEPLSIHDHRVQLMIRDGMRYRAAEKAARKAPPREVPPVQRPGTAPLKGEAQQARYRDLNANLDRSGKAKDAAKLIRAIGRAS